MARNTCKDCVYWVYQDDDEDGGVGLCHRYPPAPMNHEFPRVYTQEKEWCGELKKKQVKKKAPADPGPKDVIDHYRARFFMMFQDQPLISWGKITNMVKAYFENHTAQDLKRVIDYFFDDVPEYSEEHNLFTLEHILGQYNQLIARAAANKTPLNTRDGLLMEQAELWGSHPLYSTYVDRIRDLNNPPSFEKWREDNAV